MSAFYCYMIFLLTTVHTLLIPQEPEVKYQPNAAITYTLNGGRFGDNLQSFSQAFWLSYLHGIDLLFQPFEYAEQLKAYHAYEHYTSALDTRYKQKVVVSGDNTSLPGGLKDGCLYVSTFEEFPGTNWQDEGFISAVRACIAPVNPIEYAPLPEDMHTIAIHARRGGGFIHDSNARYYCPHHFPDLSYYIGALKALLGHLEGPCYVYFFTDDPDPVPLIEEIKEHCTPEELARITLEYRHAGNRHDAHVIEDFFDMMRYSYLIRAFSGYSCFVERLGNCKIAITSTKAQRGSPWGIVHEVAIATYTDRQKQQAPIRIVRVPYSSIMHKKLGDLL